MKIQELIFVARSQPKMVRHKIKMDAPNRPTINNANQEDYLGIRRRQRECGKKAKSQPKVLDEVRVSGVEV